MVYVGVYYNGLQYVYLNGITSSLKDITCEVPQGSMLDLLLFLLYINDLQIFQKY